MATKKTPAQPVPPRPEGAPPGPAQGEDPSTATTTALEIFWARHGKGLVAGATAAVLLLAGVYLYRNVRQAQELRAWGEFLRATGLYEDMVGRGRGMFMDEWRTDPQYHHFWRNMAAEALVGQLPARLKQVDQSVLGEQIQQARGTAREPYLLWIQAHARFHTADFAGARQAARDLMERFADHPLCQKVPWPVTYLPAEDPAEERQRKFPLPEQPPEPASGLDLLLAAIEAAEGARAAYPWLYEAPEPDPSPTVAFRISGDGIEGTVRIRLYREQAPRLTAHFLERVREGFYTGVRIHEVRRPPPGEPQPEAAHYLTFGLPESREEDRETWRQPPEPRNPLPLEPNLLAPFPGTLAAPQVVAEGQQHSSGELVRIYATDASLERAENQSVVFGRVVEGLELVQAICNAPFGTAREEEAGRGIPTGYLTIEEVTVEGEEERDQEGTQDEREEEDG